MEKIDAYCKERFEVIETKLDKKADEIIRQGTDIEVLKSDLIHLTKSLTALSNALWGMACTIGVSLFGFVLWYIQKL